MKLAHIGSIATYHKCIKQLKEFGYLEYFPSYDPSLGSQIYLNGKTKCDKGSNIWAFVFKIDWELRYFTQQTNMPRI